MKDPSITEITADIVTAYVTNNSISSTALPELINLVHASLKRLANGESAVPDQERKPEPAVPIRKSVTPDFIVCLEDGKKFRSLKRHLSLAYNITPDSYRTKWGLPDDYPMVAPNYAAQRSAFAKSIGLGKMHGMGGRKAR